MIKPLKFTIFFMLLTILGSCSGKNEKDQLDNMKEKPGEAGLWLSYSKEATVFKLWSPDADKVRLNLYKAGKGGKPYKQMDLEQTTGGMAWIKKLDGDWNGTYYTYQIKMDGEWLDETPGIYAKAVGVNGKRAMVLDMELTDPLNWDQDRGPELKYPNEAIIYELHIRDMTIHPESGSSGPGTYLGLVESGTRGPDGVATGIDHLKELGVNYVHLLPTFDHYAINESRLDSAQFNWGYDPQNYNVPEGSFSSDPFQAEVRIKEFKEMVKTFHDHGIGVILDVVYNHTGRTENSNFNLENPEYYYRFREDGTYSDAAACGNETASEKIMMRKFILESVKYWAEEYHLDGFRFDLMGIHDIETMNQVAQTLKEVNPNIFVYGEGWTAGNSPLPEEKRALKKHIRQMPQITAFSDDIRDGLKGSVFEDESTGFVSGARGTEESVKFGIVGSIDHPQVDYGKINYSDAPWANDPWQAISYVSCHDNHTLFDKLKVSMPEADEKTLIAMNKLANAVVMTSQGVAFIHAGSEMLRTKDEEHNSYNLPDIINQIDWNWKVEHRQVFEYYRNLITLRKNHPAFRMTSGEAVRKHLSFVRSEPGLIAYEIKDHANGDPWKNILVILNANEHELKYVLKDEWEIALLENDFKLEKTPQVKNVFRMPGISMAILFQR
ncbi:type I pullulanase [Lutimonas zeaxanthinifaciens]|uniref:type I pullulanase n=1 Tax=Lutimonas zeaxanthinifaciens TaxID=3060215 RepID=UPI00265CB213|nr:type I pullulanase [Lutimonas sp. YSD2104]WKK67189.1 type I pullulanase [Lutimonas sp. YSD2104]